MFTILLQDTVLDYYNKRELVKLHYLWWQRRIKSYTYKSVHNIAWNDFLKSKAHTHTHTNTTEKSNSL